MNIFLEMYNNRLKDLLKHVEEYKLRGHNEIRLNDISFMLNGLINQISIQDDEIKKLKEDNKRLSELNITTENDDISENKMSMDELRREVRHLRNKIKNIKNSKEK